MANFIDDLCTTTDHVARKAAARAVDTGAVPSVVEGLQRALEAGREGAAWGVYVLAERAGAQVRPCEGALRSAWDRLSPKDSQYAPLALVAMHADLDEPAASLLAQHAVKAAYLLRSLAVLVRSGAPASAARIVALDAIASSGVDQQAYGWALAGALVAAGADLTDAIAVLPKAIANKQPRIREWALYTSRQLLERGADVSAILAKLKNAKGPPKTGFERLACQAAVTLRTRLHEPKPEVLRVLAPELVGMMNNDDVWELFRADAHTALLRLAAVSADDRTLVRELLPRGENLTGGHHIDAVRAAVGS